MDGDSTEREMGVSIRSKPFRCPNGNSLEFGKLQRDPEIYPGTRHCKDSRPFLPLAYGNGFLHKTAAEDNEILDEGREI
ncbi:hypothetical protein CDAR_205001 [Caerostris darwini]|uniref:Uncharacterized protein n=1 Tax=Caerostris darwini TaxID=1538125 RepID=A0AAV4SU98_9ARAC|nr:hypothetical protein CDAR_205001 [Caerostris darwini]